MLLSLSGKMAITAAFILISYYTTEFFSTKYRARVMGDANMWARIGGVTSPYINDILVSEILNRLLPILIFSTKSSFVSNTIQVEYVISTCRVLYKLGI